MVFDQYVGYWNSFVFNYSLIFPTSFFVNTNPTSSTNTFYPQNFLSLFLYIYLCVIAWALFLPYSCIFYCHTSKTVSLICIKRWLVHFLQSFVRFSSFPYLFIFYLVAQNPILYLEALFLVGFKTFLIDQNPSCHSYI